MRAPVHPIARELDEGELTVEEFEARLRRTLADEDGMREMRELVRWFRRRYPTVEERLAYARRKYKEITANRLEVRSR